MSVDTAARRLHPVTPVVDLLALSRQLAIPLVIVLFGGSGELGVIVPLLAVAAVLLVARLIRWWRFSYEVTDGALRIDEGLFTRKRREVPIERIQITATHWRPKPARPGSGPREA